MTTSFQRSHEILIEAPPQVVYDYVCNPNSWPEWLAASHHIESDNRPLDAGDTFREQWHIHRGEVALNWTVTESDSPMAWTVRADTDFIGPIVIRYTFEPSGSMTRYKRQLSNPSRPSPPTEKQIGRIDEEAKIGLANIKRQVESRLRRPDRAESAGAPG
jgi:uncharacterized protein YndB with AHSA1/START domain